MTDNDSLELSRQEQQDDEEFKSFDPSDEEDYIYCFKYPRAGRTFHGRSERVAFEDLPKDLQVAIFETYEADRW